VSGHRRRKGHHEEHHVDERWLVSYSDMITVLMALFIVLYAMSTVDQQKSAKVDENKAIVPKKYVTKDGSGFSNSTIALQQVAKEIQNELKTAGIGSKVTVKAGSNAITISLVGSSAYFDGNDADLRPDAMDVLQKLAPSLKKHAGTVTVEGHADPHGSSGRWGNDWNLAGARATSVLLYFVDHKDIDPANISTVSFGSENAKPGSGATAVEHNRRVDVVLHSVQVDTAASSAKTATASGGSGSSSQKTEAEAATSHH
jgi:chemotaxis protein MotB